MCESYLKRINDFRIDFKRERYMGCISTSHISPDRPRKKIRYHKLSIQHRRDKQNNQVIYHGKQ